MHVKVQASDFHKSITFDKYTAGFFSLTCLIAGKRGEGKKNVSPYMSEFFNFSDFVRENLTHNCLCKKTKMKEEFSFSAFRAKK